AVAYFMDPDRGRGRRTMTRDRMLALARRTGVKLERRRRAIQAQAFGAMERLRHTEPEDSTPDDGKLKDRIESEVFSRHRSAKGKVNIDVTDSTAEIRGELQTPDQIRELESAVLRVAGVRGLDSMLHLPGEPAPNKRAAREAS